MGVERLPGYSPSHVESIRHRCPRPPGRRRGKAACCRHRAEAHALPELRDARPCRSPALGGADRPERRRQDQPPRSGLAALAGTRHPRRPARRDRDEGRRDLRGRGAGRQCRRRGRSRHRRGGRADGARIETAGPRQPCAGRLLRRAPRPPSRPLADAVDGRALHRPAGRPPPLSRPGGAVDRQGATARAPTPSRRRCAAATGSSPSRRRTPPGSMRSRPRWPSSASPSPRRGANGRRSPSP